MKKFVISMLVLILIVSLAVQAQAITPGVWGETNYGYTQPVEPTEPPTEAPEELPENPTEAPEELPENPGECCWLGWLWRWLEWLDSVRD